MLLTVILLYRLLFEQNIRNVYFEDSLVEFLAWFIHLLIRTKKLLLQALTWIAENNLQQPLNKSFFSFYQCNNNLHTTNYYDIAISRIVCVAVILALHLTVQHVAEYGAH